jgi:hypothetical protein
MAKACAICETACEDSAIQCSKCGGGVFASFKPSRETNQSPTLVQADKPPQTEPRLKGTAWAYLVSRAEVIAGDISLVTKAANDCIASYKRNGSLELLKFGIGGFDDDPRHLCDVPQVRSWCAKLYQTFPIFAIIDTMTIEWLLPCVADVKVVGKGSASTQVEWPNNLADLINTICERAEHLFRSMSGSDHNVSQLYGDYMLRMRAAAKKLGL